MLSGDVCVVVMGLAVTKQEAFWEACGFGNIERVRKLIAEGIDVNWVSYTVRQLASFRSVSLSVSFKLIMM